MPNIIHEGITNLDVVKINFEDKEAVRELLLRLLNTVEQLAQSNQELRKENLQLNDEINRLKGEAYGDDPHKGQDLAYSSHPRRDS